MKHSVKLLLVSAASFGLLTACGGGGGGGSTIGGQTAPSGNSQIPVIEAPTFEAGLFAPADDFADRCENPRIGRADVQGSNLIEKFWLRSWTDETYLFFDEVPSLDPNLTEDRVDYFDLLRTDRRTASGKFVDDFHFSQSTEEFESARSGEASSGFGANFAVLQGSPPRDIRVAFTQANSPASASNGLRRGDEILVIDGIDAVNGGATASDLDVIINGLFPPAAGTNVDFTVRGVDGVEREVTLTSADVVEQPVTATSIIDVDDSLKVGYIHFTTFSPVSSEAAIVSAMSEMEAAGVDDLVLDLRYNGGGLLFVAAQVGFMIAGDEATDDRVFDALTFNSKNTVTNPVTGERLRPTPFIGESIGFDEDLLRGGLDLPELNLNRVFILSTEGTCSASEAVINGLRGIDVEVILIGTQTCGKPFGFFPTDNCGETYFTIQFQGSNDKGFGEYSDGFLPNDGPNGFGEQVPGCTIPDTFAGTLGNEEEPLLAAALQFAEDGTCPNTPVISKKAEFPTSRISLNPELDILNNPRLKMDQFLKTNRILGITDGDIESFK